MATILERLGRSTISKLRSRIVATGKFSVLAGLCVSLLTACPPNNAGFKPAMPGNPNGPQLMSNVGEIPGLPNALGRFERGQVVAYRPGQRDFSVGYDIRDPGQLAVSTVYFYTLDGGPPGLDRSLAAQFADSSASLRQANPGAVLIEQSRRTVTQGGAVVEGLSATFRYEKQFAGQRRMLASELHVFRIGDHFVKFRNSYPWEQRDIVAPQVAELIRQLDWSDPAAVTAHLLSL